MKRLWLIWVFLLAACSAPTHLITTPTPLPPATTPQIIHIACPEDLVPLMMSLAASYQRDVPDVKITVMSRANMLAYDALQQGDADIAVFNWLPTNVPTTLWSTPFARDGLAIIVNPQNGLPGLTMEQLRQLFQGQTENWESWGGLPGAPQIVSREEAAGMHQFFQRSVMRDVRVTLTALLAPDCESMLTLIKEDSLAVGYVSAAWLNDGVRALAIDGIPPSAETIAARVYPLTYDVHLAMWHEPQGASRDFIQWVLDSQGQGLVVAHGLQSSQ